MECMLVLRGVSGLWSLRWAQEPVLIGNGERLSLHPPPSLGAAAGYVSWRAFLGASRGPRLAGW